MYVYICVYVCVYTHTHTHIYTYIYIWAAALPEVTWIVELNKAGIARNMFYIKFL